MFANPFWSLAILAGLAGMYGIIRYRHGGPLLDSSHTWWDWIVAFRTWVAASLTGLALALPDVLVLIAPFDFSPWIGAEYAKVVTLVFGVFMAVNASMKTKAGDVKAG